MDAVSRREGETWSEYLDRVQENPVARAVKISDLIDNSNLGRIPVVTMKDVKRQAKYNKALEKLVGERVVFPSVFFLYFVNTGWRQ